MWFAIGLISILDAYLVVWNRELILEYEENVICRALIELDSATFHYFLSAKVAGTSLVLAALRAIFLRLWRHGLIITSGVAAYQCGLLCYLFL